MQVKNGKDFWAGLMFIGFGLAFTLVALNYPMGSALDMGPAYFPVVLGSLLAILGGVVFLGAFVSKFNNPLNIFIFRPFVLIASLAVGGGTYWLHSWLKGAPMIEFLLIGLALAMFILAFGPPAMYVILLAVLIFGYALKSLGMVPAIVLLIVIAAAGGHDFRKKEVVILTILLVLFSVLVFVKALGLPFSLWPGGD